uniref:GIY-YIG endonuclease n=1 Tax=Hirsutella thompsonii TaxID=42368 RepID=A0A3G2ZP95_HIRTH|nr:GIY-YIG endonuclease [Hirsutella thompsonii]
MGLINPRLQILNLYNVRSHSLCFRSSNYKFISPIYLLEGHRTITIRLFSCCKQNLTLNKTNDSFKSSTDFMVFSNTDKDKLVILKYVKGKAGIYMWTNKLNGGFAQKYVGSTVNLRRRLLEYYNVNRLLIEKSMPIYLSLLKHGYQNFSFTILEFCDIDSLVSREKHFFDVYSASHRI